MKKISSEEALLLKILGLYYFSTSIAGIFVNVFLFSHGTLQTVVHYSLITIIVLYILYILSGWLLKKFSSTDFIRVGLCVGIIHYGIFFLLGEKSILYLFPLAVLNGASLGFFWPGYNLSQYILTNTGTRNNYFGKQNFLIGLSNSLGPVLGGTIISIFGFYYTKNLGYSFVFLLVSILLAYISVQASLLPKHSEIEFSLNHIVYHKRSKNWHIVLIQQFLAGLYDVSFAVLSSILIYLIVKGEFMLGVVNTINTLILAAGSIFAGKLLQKVTTSYLAGTILVPLGLLFFAMNQNWLGIVSMIALSTLFSSLLSIATAKSFFDEIDAVNESWKNKYHFLIERDSILGFGRIISYLLLLLFFTESNQIQIATNWIFIIPLFPLLIGLLQYYKDLEGS